MRLAYRPIGKGPVVPFHNARCQRLSEDLANRNIDATDIACIIKSITTFQL